MFYLKKQLLKQDTPSSKIHLQNQDYLIESLILEHQKCQPIIWITSLGYYIGKGRSKQSEAMSATDYCSILMTSEQASLTSVLSKYNICTSFRSTGKIQNEKMYIPSHLYYSNNTKFMKIKFNNSFKGRPNVYLSRVEE